MSASLQRLSKFYALLCLFAALGLFSSVGATAPRCESLFISRGAEFKSEIQGRLDPSVYQDVLRQVDDVLGALSPLPEGYVVVLKSQHGQGAKNIFGAKRVEFTEVHTTYRKYTGKEDPRITLPILVHEYSHAYFEANMRELSPLWEQNSRFLDMPFADPQMKQQLALPLTVYHEFFADLVPSVLFKNPGAMQEALQFHESLTPSRTLPFRHFEGYEAARDQGTLKKIFQDQDPGVPYIYLAPLRNSLWKELQSRDLNQQQLQEVFRIVVEVLAKDYQARAQSGNFGFNSMNRDLEGALQKALAELP